MVMERRGNAPEVAGVVIDDELEIAPRLPEDAGDRTAQPGAPVRADGDRDNGYVVHQTSARAA
jgi:hypothetical protein